MTINLSLGEIEELQGRTATKKIAGDECTKILHLAILSLKTFSNAFHKETCYISRGDIEKIQSALANYKNTEEKSKLFKQELMEDLNTFKKQLDTKTCQQIISIEKQAASYKEQIKQLKTQTYEAEKNLLNRLVGNPIKKENDAKIALINLRIEQYAKQVQELKTNGTTANEKEILLYQMHLKEKYIIQ